MTERIVVAGFGPVAARFIDMILPLVSTGGVHLTVLGTEPDPAYNRVLVADVGVGRTTTDAITLSDPDGLRSAGADVRLGATVRRIDRARRLVLLADGVQLPYDRLVLATGARPVIPFLTGLNPDPQHTVLPRGVTTLRDLPDARILHATVASRGSIVILGGGILGLEAALAAAEEGAQVTVVHNGPVPLGRSIDDGGGSVLASTLEARGVRLVSGARAVGLDTTEGGGFAALRLDDGRHLPGDLLVLSCGVRPRIDLAEGAGLPVATGILVNHGLRAHHEENIWAIGDCAEIDCAESACTQCAGDTAPSGLIGPGWRQAEWLAESFTTDLAGRAEPDAGVVEPAGSTLAVPAAPGSTAAVAGSSNEPAVLRAEAAPVLMLKARGVDAVMAGNTQADPWTAHKDGIAVALWADPEHGRYAKMVTRNGVLEGLVCIGMPRTGAELVLLFERRGELPADRSSLLRLDGAGDGALPSSVDPAATVCRCAGVTRGSIEQAAAVGCGTVAEVSAGTRAGTGCGSCHADIRSIIEQHFQTAVTPAH